MMLTGAVFCSCDSDDAEEYSSSEDIAANIVAEDLLEKTVRTSSDVVNFKNIELFKKGKEKCRMSGKATVNMTYSITPLYLHHSWENPLDGDYYIVEGTISIISDEMYKGYQTLKWGNGNRHTTRVRGFFLNNLDFDVSVNAVDDMSRNVEFSEIPYPMTTINSKTYTSGISWNLNGCVSGGKSGIGGTVETGVNFKKSESYSLSDVSIRNCCDTQKGIVNYNIAINNLPDSYDKEPPLVSRNTLDFHFAWVWRIPHTKVNDTSTRYKMTVKINNLTYQCNNGDNFDNTIVSKTLAKEFELPLPNRVPTGSVELNNDQDMNLDDIVYTNIDTRKEYCDTTFSAYGVSETYKRYLPVGKYNLRFKLDGTECKSNEVIEVERGKALNLKTGFYY